MQHIFCFAPWHFRSRNSNLSSHLRLGGNGQKSSGVPLSKRLVIRSPRVEFPLIDYFPFSRALLCTSVRPLHAFITVRFKFHPLTVHLLYRASALVSRKFVACSFFRVTIALAARRYFLLFS